MKREDAINQIIQATNSGPLEVWKEKIGLILDQYLLTGDRALSKLSILAPIDRDIITEELFSDTYIYYSLSSTGKGWCKTWTEFCYKKNRYNNWFIKSKHT